MRTTLFTFLFSFLLFGCKKSYNDEFNHELGNELSKPTRSNQKSWHFSIRDASYEVSNSETSVVNLELLSRFPIDHQKTIRIVTRGKQSNYFLTYHREKQSWRLSLFDSNLKLLKQFIFRNNLFQETDCDHCALSGPTSPAPQSPNWCSTPIGALFCNPNGGGGIDGNNCCSLQSLLPPDQPIACPEDCSGSGGGGGGGITFSPTVQMLYNTFGLSFDQAIWLDSHQVLAEEILDYIQTTSNQHATFIIEEHLNRLMSDAAYLSFVNAHASSSTSHKIWWEDDTWLTNPNNFNLDITFANNQYDELNEQEKALVKTYPIAAFQIRQNKQVAENISSIFMGNNGGLNDKKDAFRHAFFNAINVRDVPARISPFYVSSSTIVLLFATAHESEVPLQLELEKTMDLHNNSKGIELCINCLPVIDSDMAVAIRIQMILNAGELYYLRPTLDQNLDPDFWGLNGTINRQTATHGITNLTQLTPTNQ